MVLSLYALIEAIILFVNALAILNEERFLKPIGWGHRGGSSLEGDSVKDKIINLLSAVLPLIGINIAVIALELLLG
ncbi:hypothetical protein PROFUN_11745 [Planoprotostelium fungivorum]|uniref:Immediate early response 3-interacting protein 1 n=1 Tax=Planoprotostelium fungivorum TaxID=1890364 RepID=A0A2P6MYG2_9EUKA|nr:hypothetical protein PROFUN_11745 [Planoprotostelium fungivorum]